ncbi:hypothetical protein [Nitratifractor sp.]
MCLRFGLAFAASLRSDRFGFEANDTKQFVSLDLFSPLRTEPRHI